VASDLDNSRLWQRLLAEGQGRYEIVIGVRAVLFDLDGTLYNQSRMRALMALELGTLPATGPFRARRRWRALRAYRHAQEHLRGQDANPSTQGALAAQASGVPASEVERIADEWMQRRPLKYLRVCRAPGTMALIDWLAQAGVKLGILSDYPAAAKIAALGLDGRFDPVLCATDPDVGAFKPSPRGFLRAASIWKLPPADVLVVGDRPDADAAGAAAAGMPCVIVGRHGANPSSGAGGYRSLPTLEHLHEFLEHDR
jgi:HAD superfamily hydrolase (TIGR01549 family)